MSLETWKAEFYPIPAADCPPEQAVEHSLRKWVGLRKENLERHDVEIDEEDDVTDCETGEWLPISCGSCALCVHHDECDDCPLAKSRNGFACDDAAGDEESSPWRLWRWHNHPEPMIAALEAALRLEQEQQTAAQLENLRRFEEESRKVNIVIDG